jgi:hypothetical protein
MGADVSECMLEEAKKTGPNLTQHEAGAETEFFPCYSYDFVNSRSPNPERIEVAPENRTSG